MYGNEWLHKKGTRAGSCLVIWILNRRERFTFERFSGGHELDKVLVEHFLGVHQGGQWDSGWFHSWRKRGGEDPLGAMGLLEQLWGFVCVHVYVCVCVCVWVCVSVTTLLAALSYFKRYSTLGHLINPRCACAARVNVLGLCVCLCVCLHLFSPYRDQAGSSAIPTALAQQGLEK